MTGPYVIRCGATGGYLARGGGIVYRKSQARSWSLRNRAEAVFRKTQREPQSVIGPGNPLGWEILPRSKAEDLSI